MKSKVKMLIPLTLITLGIGISALVFAQDPSIANTKTIADIPAVTPGNPTIEEVAEGGNS
jgi:hypothetical protein